MSILIGGISLLLFFNLALFQFTHQSATNPFVLKYSHDSPRNDSRLSKTSSQLLLWGEISLLGQRFKDDINPTSKSNYSTDKIIKSANLNQRLKKKSVLVTCLVT
jgi:hypothetical protein